MVDIARLHFGLVMLSSIKTVAANALICCYMDASKRANSGIQNFSFFESVHFDVGINRVLNTQLGHWGLARRLLVMSCEKKTNCVSVFSIRNKITNGSFQPTCYSEGKDLFWFGKNAALLPVCHYVQKKRFLQLNMLNSQRFLYFLQFMSTSYSKHQLRTPTWSHVNHVFNNGNACISKFD